MDVSAIHASAFLKPSAHKSLQWSQTILSGHRLPPNRNSTTISYTDGGHGKAMCCHRFITRGQKSAQQVGWNRDKAEQGGDIKYITDGTRLS
jgi:hypothetical protein